MVKSGSIIPDGVSLEKHEYDTVLFLTTLGYKIRLIPPSLAPNTRTPDFEMIGLKWEAKSPKGKSRYTLEHAFQAATKQSENIIFDLRRTSIPDNKCKTTLSKLMKTSKRAKRLGIITKKRELVWFPFD